jgi:site-specific DNA-cytosine methylase
MWFVKSRRAKNDQDYETWVEGGVVPTLNVFENQNDQRATVLIFGECNQSVALAFEPGAMSRLPNHHLEEIAKTLRANAGDNQLAVIVFYGNRVGDIRVQDDKVNTLQARMGTGGGNMPLMNEGPTVRRLTPMECERLQGFPDGWTSHRIDEKKGLVEQSDSARYKQMGNAVAVPVVEWIMKRLVRMENGQV